MSPSSRSVVRRTSGRLPFALALITALSASSCASDPVATDAAPLAATDDRVQHPADRLPADTPTQLIRQADGKNRELPVAKLHFALEGATTRSLRDLLIGSIELAPGQQLHPPHIHAEEEFLWLASGSGVWSLAGREFEAQQGDLLYIEPWVEHGLTNTGSTPLTFFVVKWNGNGHPVPAR